MSPTLRFAGLVSLAAISALWLPVAVVISIVLALVALAVVDLRAAAPAAEFRRDVPSSLSRGVPSPLEIELDAPQGTATTIRQATPPDLSVEPPVAEGALHGAITAVRRGRHPLPAPAARVAGPLGLVALYREDEGPTEVTVYPDMPAARRLALAVREGRTRDPGLRPRGPLGLGTEFESIRDYQPDDDIRQVNWSATARTGRPMSNQFRVEHDRDVMMVVDSGRLMGADVGGRTRLDAALDVVAAVSLVADELDDRCGALAFDDRVRATVRFRRRNSATLIRELFDLQPSAADSDYELAFRRVERAKRAFVLVLTDLVDEAAARSLLTAMPLISRHHAVCVASASDLELSEAMSRAPRGPLDAHRMAVSHQVLAARREVAHRLRALGADVVEAPAPRLAAVGVRAYLRAKHRARL